MTLNEKAIKLFSNDGLKLGNYHYDVDIKKNEDGIVSEVYLTRYYEECKNCPLFNNECNGDYPHKNRPCSNMLPIEPYNESGYDFVNGYDEIEEYSEFTEIEKVAIKMIWKFTEDIFARLYSK